MNPHRVTFLNELTGRYFICLIRRAGMRQWNVNWNGLLKNLEMFHNRENFLRDNLTQPLRKVSVWQTYRTGSCPPRTSISRTVAPTDDGHFYWRLAVRLPEQKKSLIEVLIAQNS